MKFESHKSFLVSVMLMHQYFGSFLTWKGFKTIWECIPGVGRSEIRINELFADWKKAMGREELKVFAPDREDLVPAWDSDPQTFTSDTLSLFGKRDKSASKCRSVKKFLIQQVEVEEGVRTPTRPTRWPSLTRSLAVSSARAAQRLQKSGAFSSC